MGCAEPAALTGCSDGWRRPHVASRRRRAPLLRPTKHQQPLALRSVFTSELAVLYLESKSSVDLFRPGLLCSCYQERSQLAPVPVWELIDELT